MIFGRSGRFKQDNNQEYKDYGDFCKARYLKSKGASEKDVKTWFSKKPAQTKGYMTPTMTSRNRTNRAVTPHDDEELNTRMKSRGRQKHRVSVEKAQVRENIPYFYPEQVPGPGSYKVQGSLIKPTHNRRVDESINFQMQDETLDFDVPISLEDFERTYTCVPNGSYLNHNKTYRSRSAPSTGRRKENQADRKRYFKPKYNPIVDLENCPSDALLGRWSSVHMDSYQWNTKAYGRRGANYR